MLSDISKPGSNTLMTKKKSKLLISLSLMTMTSYSSHHLTTKLSKKFLKNNLNLILILINSNLQGKDAGPKVAIVKVII